jgi:hypothetical protein
MSVTLSDLQQMAARGEKIAMLTCYDASFAKLKPLAWMFCWWAIRWAWCCKAHPIP